ncbi:hypothetical protein BH11PLA1_BH11PLA1_23550 [soil metagenome]
MTHDISRRGILQAGAVLGAGALLAGRRALGGVSAEMTPAARGAALAGATILPAAGKKRVARIAHLTDVHVQPERHAGEGLAACLAHVQALPDRPTCIVTGGDLVMESFEATDARTQLQWELFTKTMRDHCGLPCFHSLGNHDIWGWNKGKSGTKGDEPKWGKVRAVETLGMPGRYHAHDLAPAGGTSGAKGGWRIIHLDSVTHDPLNENGYIGELDGEQMEWLKEEIGALKPDTHALIVSHIPILSVTVFANEVKPDGTFHVPAGVMHKDSAILRGMFEKSGRVRACISGHMHRLDRIDFRGIRYACNGAVSGNWWKGAHAEAFEGYTVIDLFEDGSMGSEYVGYGWNASE